MTPRRITIKCEAGDLDLADDIQDALIEAGAPFYVKNNKLIYLIEGDRVVMQTPRQLAYWIEGHLRFQRWNERRQEYQPVNAPLRALQELLRRGRPGFFGCWKFQNLDDDATEQQEGGS